MPSGGQVASGFELTLPAPMPMPAVEPSNKDESVNVDYLFEEESPEPEEPSDNDKATSVDYLFEEESPEAEQTSQRNDPALLRQAGNHQSATHDQSVVQGQQQTPAGASTTRDECIAQMRQQMLQMKERLDALESRPHDALRAPAISIAQPSHQGQVTAQGPQQEAINAPISQQPSKGHPSQTPSPASIHRCSNSCHSFATILTNPEANTVARPQTAAENITAKEDAANKQKELKKANEAKEKSAKQADNEAKKLANPSRPKKASDPAQEAAKADARAEAKARQRRAMSDKRPPNDIYGLNTEVTPESHPGTYMVKFREPGLSMGEDYMTSRSFHNLVEWHMERIDPGKQRSFHYPHDTLEKIRNGIEIPPENWPQEGQAVATWKFNLRHKFQVKDNQVYKKTDKGKVEDCPILATEEWYALLARIHHKHGHLGRDDLYKRVCEAHEGIGKSLISDYVAQCCTMGLSKNRVRLSDQAKGARQELLKRKRDEADAGMEAPEARRPRMGEDEIQLIPPTIPAPSLELPGVYMDDNCDFIMPNPEYIAAQRAAQEAQWARMPMAPVQEAYGFQAPMGETDFQNFGAFEAQQFGSMDSERIDPPISNPNQGMVDNMEDVQLEQPRPLHPLDHFNFTAYLEGSNDEILPEANPQDPLDNFDFGTFPGGSNNEIIPEAPRANPVVPAEMDHLPMHMDMDMGMNNHLFPEEPLPAQTFDQGFDNIVVDPAILAGDAQMQNPATSDKEIAWWLRNDFGDCNAVAA